MITNGDGGYVVRATVRSTSEVAKPSGAIFSIDSEEPGRVTIEVTDENLKIAYVTVYLADLERVVDMIASNPHITF
jgi:hypothetical protein